MTVIHPSFASIIFVLSITFSSNCWAGEKPLTAKVMSFNVRNCAANDGANNWSNRRELVCDVIKQFDPDFLGLQEARPPQVDFLKERFPQYDCTVVFRNKVPLTGESCALFYRRDFWRLDPDDHGTFWLSKTPNVRGSKSWHTACTRIVTWGRFISKPKSEQAVYVYNTHFEHKSKLAREKSAELIASHIAKRRHSDPLVLMGDFNAGESSRPIEYLTDLGPVKLVDTFRVLHPDAKNTGTFCKFIGTMSGNKIDYIFVLPGTKVLDARIIHYNLDGRYPSDHFPVTATLQFSSN